MISPHVDEIESDDVDSEDQFESPHVDESNLSNPKAILNSESHSFPSPHFQIKNKNITMADDTWLATSTTKMLRSLTKQMKNLLSVHGIQFKNSTNQEAPRYSLIFTNN